MFRIKICGVTTVDDARMVAEAGADAIGLNFYAQSKRYVSIDRALEIAASLPKHVATVGVFVNATADEIRATVEQVGLDLVQLHGDETPELIHQLSSVLRDVTVIKAFRLGPSALQPVEQFLFASCARGQASPPQVVLFDAAAPGQYGGTGETIDWSLAKQFIRRVGVDGPPLILAGGLTPENVAGAISVVHPAAVDTASGVESSPGRKDPAKVAAFVTAAREAFARFES